MLHTQTPDDCAALLEALRAQNLTIATAESCTGGLIAAALTAIAGSSSSVLGGFVVYSNAMKTAHLGVPEGVLAAVGAVSEAVARLMAEGALARSGADIALSCTGIAGPGGATPGKPVGLVHVAVAGPDGCESEGIHFGASRGRHWIQTLACGEALQRLRLRLG